MRGAYVQPKEVVAIRQSWRNCCNSAPPAEFARLSESYPLRQSADSPDAQTLDTSQPHRLWSSPGRKGNTMLPSNSAPNVPGAARRRVYRQGGRKPVLFAHAVKNPDMAPDVAALLAEQTSNKRLGNTEAKLNLPVHIWYLWSATGIRSGTSKNSNTATGIRSGTCGGVFQVPQVSDMNHSY